MFLIHRGYDFTFAVAIDGYTDTTSVGCILYNQATKQQLSPTKRTDSGDTVVFYFSSSSTKKLEIGVYGLQLYKLVDSNTTLSIYYNEQFARCISAAPNDSINPTEIPIKGMPKVKEEMGDIGDIDGGDKTQTLQQP